MHKHTDIDAQAFRNICNKEAAHRLWCSAGWEGQLSGEGNVLRGELCRGGNVQAYCPVGEVFGGNCYGRGMSRGNI